MKFKPNCMDKNKKTRYPHCTNGADGFCSVQGCHGFYPSSDEAKKPVEPTADAECVWCGNNMSGKSCEHCGF